MIIHLLERTFRELRRTLGPELDRLDPIRDLPSLFPAGKDEQEGGKDEKSDS